MVDTNRSRNPISWNEPYIENSARMVQRLVRAKRKEQNDLKSCLPCRVELLSGL